jgi:hypothetical protein
MIIQPFFVDGRPQNGQVFIFLFFIIRLSAGYCKMGRRRASCLTAFGKPNPMASSPYPVIASPALVDSKSAR